MQLARCALVVVLLVCIGCYSTDIALDPPEGASVDSRLIGEWSFPAATKSKTFTAVIRPADDKRNYLVEYSDDQRSLRGTASVIRIKDATFVQIRPQKPDDPDTQERLMARVSVSDDGKLSIQQLNPYFFYPKRLTAPDHLQDLLERNLDNPDMYQGGWRTGTKAKAD